MGFDLFKDISFDDNSINLKTELKIVWLDKNIGNKENLKYQKIIKNELPKIYNLEFFAVKTIEDSISILTNINFIKTIIIVSGKYYENFVEKFYSIQNELNLKETIVVFCGSKKGLLYYCENNNIYINEYLVFDRFVDLLNFLKIQKIEINEEYSFEIVKNNNELILPIFYQDFIEAPSNESIFLFHNLLKENYKNDKKIYPLLEQIDNVFELNTLCKYWIRIYTEDTDFFKDMNKDLRKRINVLKYMTFIKLFYQGIKQNIFTPAITNLYRGSVMSKKEFDNFLNFQHMKSKDNKLKMIMYSITFLSFSKSKCAAQQFLLNESEEKIKILFEVIPDNNIDDEIGKISNIDINQLSSQKGEQEVLFGPFSVFEFISIDNISNKSFYSNNCYYIKLNYLGKYRKEIISEFEHVQKLDFIPPTKFSLELLELDFIKINFSLNWSIIRKKNLRINNIIYYNNIIIGSCEKSILILNTNFEIKDRINNALDEVIVRLKMIKDTIFISGKKIIKIIQLKKDEDKYSYNFINKIYLDYENIKSFLLLSDYSLLLITSINKIKLYQKKNGKYEYELKYNSICGENSPIISLIEFPKLNYITKKKKEEINYFATLSTLGELKFWNFNLKCIDKINIQGHPIEHNMMLFKEYLIIICTNSISMMNYNTKKELAFYLDYQIIRFNKFNEDSFLICMKNRNEQYFFNEYYILKEKAEILLECTGNSNFESKKFSEILKISNKEIITTNENEIIYWKKNKTLKQKVLNNKIIEGQEIIEENKNDQSTNLSRTKSIFENNELKKSITINNEETIKEMDNMLSNNLNINKIRNQKYNKNSLKESFFPEPHWSNEEKNTNMMEMMNEN